MYARVRTSTRSEIDRARPSGAEYDLILVSAVEECMMRAPRGVYAHARATHALC